MCSNCSGDYENPEEEEEPTMPDLLDQTLEKAHTLQELTAAEKRAYRKMQDAHEAYDAASRAYAESRDTWLDAQTAVMAATTSIEEHLESLPKGEK